MLQRIKDWHDPSFDPYKHDPVVFFSCTLSALVWILAVVMLALIHFVY